MSSGYNYNENDLDAILAEFSDYSEGLTEKREQRPESAKPAEPEAPAPEETAVPAPEPVEIELEAEQPEPPKPEIPQAVYIPTDEAPLPDLPEVPPVKARRAGAERHEAKISAEQSEKPRKAKREKPQNVPAPESAKAEKKPRQAGSRAAGFFISLLFMCVSVIVLAWVGVNVHPDSGSVASSSGSSSLQLSSKLDTFVNNLASDALGDLTYIRKIYTIDENSTSAPAPDETKYGSVMPENAAEVMDVIQQARDSGLLDGQDVIFNTDINFRSDTAIKYYCDDTILVICWKEIIDGNTCSCVEVKIADASQFKRKIADDTFGSTSQYYATTLAKQANATVAMNADFYQFRDFGIVVYQRELYRFGTSTYTGSYKMYNCIDNCFVTGSGDFMFMHKGEETTEEALRQYIQDNDILFSIAFGPILVEDGVVQTCDWYPAGEPTTGYSRAGIGQYDSLHYFYMGLNHSNEKSARWTVNEFAEHFGEKGVKNAYGLDGGQTGEIVFQGEPYNYIDYGNERLVSDIIYFATAIPEEERAQ